MRVLVECMGSLQAVLLTANAFPWVDADTVVDHGRIEGGGVVIRCLNPCTGSACVPISYTGCSHVSARRLSKRKVSVVTLCAKLSRHAGGRATTLSSVSVYCTCIRGHHHAHGTSVRLKRDVACLFVMGNC